MDHYRAIKRRSRRHATTHRVQFIPLSTIDKNMYDGARKGALLNISKYGVGMRIKGESLDVGSLITLLIPASVRMVTVPVLTEVRWVKEERPGEYQAGLCFVL